MSKLTLELDNDNFPATCNILVNGIKIGLITSFKLELCSDGSRDIEARLLDDPSMHEEYIEAKTLLQKAGITVETIRLW